MELNDLDTLTKEINKIQRDKAELHRQQYTGALSKTKFENRLVVIEEQERVLVKKKIELLNTLQQQKDQELEARQNKILEEAKEVAQEQRARKEWLAQQNPLPKPKQTQKQTQKQSPPQRPQRPQQVKIKKQTQTKPKKQIITKPKKQIKIIKQQPQKKVNANIEKGSTMTFKEIITKALMNEQIDSEDKVLYVIDKFKPGNDKDNLRRVIRNTLSILKKDPKYVWQDNKYLLKEAK